MTITQQEFAARRKKLIEKLGPNAIAILVSAPEKVRTSDTDYPYRQDSDFYYLTGFTEPHSIAVFISGRKEGEFILFNRVRDATQETWHGRRAGQEGAVKNFGADQAFPMDAFKEKLPELLLGCEKIYYLVGRYPDFDRQLLENIDAIHRRVRMGLVAPREMINLEQILHRMRQIKSEGEIALMRKAAQISAQGHIRAMKICKPGLHEYALEAELMHEFYRNGSRSPAYTSIVCTGENTCILHYHENDAEIKSGDMILIDAGCEYQYYTSDVTRSFPANGTFSPEQKAIYEIVLAAQLAAIAEAKPGSNLDKVHNVALEIITKGLVDLGLLKGSVNELIASKAYMPFYMHRTGHWLGLDTHDVGRYKMGDMWCAFEPGMAHTVEPGIYIAANTPGVDPKWWNIGVRIEDDVVITKDGCEVLSKGVPKSIAEIEGLMAAK